MSKQNKTSFSETVVEKGVELFAALAHPVRLRILLELRDHGTLSVGNLSEILKIEQSSMSHQLAILKRTHLVKSNVEGKSRMYELADKHVAHIVGDALIHVGEA